MARATAAAIARAAWIAALVAALAAGDAHGQAKRVKRSAWPRLEPLVAARLERAGLRVVRSDHCELVTDLAASATVDELPRVVDLAAPQWEQRFGVGVGDWRVRAFVIDDRSRFEAAGLMPDGRAFPHGLALGYRVWVNEQPSAYFRRALLLHEATHSFMMTRLGGCGPGWHMEGVAELCGAHAWDAAARALRIAVMPASREAAPYWGRVKLVREAPPLAIDAVLRIDNRRALPTDEYAWAWALAHFLDHHPRYRERFRALSGNVRRADFDERFRAAYAADRGRLDREWRLFAATLVYGHDLTREAIAFGDGAALGVGATATVAADRGWQSSGIRLEAGRRYRITGSGRFVVGRDPDGTAWQAEAGGVSLEHHAGRPLGELLATVDAGPASFTEPTAIGWEGTLTPKRAGTLYFRVNDSPARLAENRGELSVAIAVD